METKLYRQLEKVLSENGVASVVDTLALVIEEADAWNDSSFQAFTVKVLRDGAARLRDEDWRRELDEEEQPPLKEIINEISESYHSPCDDAEFRVGVGQLLEDHNVKGDH